jgi:preprotein translocase subunit SecE
MAMNRAQKRMLQKQGALGADGEPTRGTPPARKAPAPRGQEATSGGKEKRTSPVEFLKEVRSELRKVAWPTKTETINYSIICFLAIVVLTGFIALVDYGASNFVLKLYGD